VIRIVLRPQTVAHTRFVVSPLLELSSVLMMLVRARAGEPPHAARLRRLLERVRTAIADQRLELLDALAMPFYVPDFMCPHPQEPEPDIERELRQVAQAPVSRIRAEMQIVVSGRPVANLTGHPLAPVLTDALADGERAFAERVAGELGRLWRATLASDWPAIRAELDADIQRRAGVLARHGVAGLLSSLNSQISWHGDELHVVSRYDTVVTWGESIILVPAVASERVLVLVDPVQDERREPVLCYPLDDRPAPVDPEPGGDTLLGATRNALLVDLEAARTTTELSRRHRLSVSAVSYHLSILHRSGMVSRSRIGSSVFYQRTEHGEAVLTAISAPYLPKKA
jgi:DNA-binding transcriptional ArsR family regulator